MAEIIATKMSGLETAAATVQSITIDLHYRPAVLRALSMSLPAARCHADRVQYVLVPFSSFLFFSFPLLTLSISALSASTVCTTKIKKPSQHEKDDDDDITNC